MGLRLFLLVALWGSTLWADFKVSGDWLEIAQPHFRVALPDGFVQVTPRTPLQDWNCVMAWVGEDAAGTGFTSSFHVTHETLAPDSDLSGQFRPRTPPVSFSWYREEWQHRDVWCSRAVHEDSGALGVILAAYVPLSDGTLRMEVGGPLQRELSVIKLSRWLLRSLEGSSHWPSTGTLAASQVEALGGSVMDRPRYGEAFAHLEGTTVASAVNDLLLASLVVALIPGFVLMIMLAARRREEPTPRARLVHHPLLPPLAAGTGGPVPPPGTFHHRRGSASSKH